MSDSVTGTPYFFGIEDEVLLQRASELRGPYATAEPFPHAVVDDLLPPAAAGAILGAFPTESAFGHLQGEPIASERHQPGKHGLRHARHLASMPEGLADHLARFQGSLFVRFLELLTGIRGLVPDPHLKGAGVHLVRNGGHVDVHLDFNVDPDTGLHRRVNVLLYLNEDWHPGFGGQLELWRSPEEGPVQSIEPRFNRCVIFTAGAGAWHGHPRPLQLPPGRARRSLAFYYYTAAPPDGFPGEHGTLWRGARRQSSPLERLRGWLGGH